jgi:hypothetical protein
MRVSVSAIWSRLKSWAQVSTYPFQAGDELTRELKPDLRDDSVSRSLRLPFASYVLVCVFTFSTLQRLDSIQ